MALALALTALACPIRRPPVPMEFYPFRDALRDSVAAVTYAGMSERPAVQDRVEESIPDLSTVDRTDSLFVRLRRDPLLQPLAVPLEATLQAVLRSDASSGGVRKAFRKPEGQRLAVDAILIGLGQALRRLRVEREVGDPGSPSPPRPGRFPGTHPSRGRLLSPSSLRREVVHAALLARPDRPRADGAMLRPSRPRATLDRGLVELDPRVRRLRRLCPDPR